MPDQIRLVETFNRGRFTAITMLAGTDGILATSRKLDCHAKILHLLSISGVLNYSNYCLPDRSNIRTLSDLASTKEMFMAALDSTDLRAILGDDYLARKDELERAGGLDQAGIDAKDRLASLAEKKLPLFGGGLLGVLLLVATKWSPSETAATNQTILGVGLIVICLGCYVWIRNELKKGGHAG